MKQIITFLLFLYCFNINAQPHTFEIDTDEIDFGKSICGEIISKKIKITNHSGTDTSVEGLVGGVQTFAGWCIVILPKEIVKNGESATIEVKCRVRQTNGAYSTKFIFKNNPSYFIYIKGISICED